jgi:hypothetical protein
MQQPRGTLCRAVRGASAPRSGPVGAALITCDEPVGEDIIDGSAVSDNPTFRGKIRRQVYTIISQNNIT